jgi:hypothetical protein
VLAGGNVNITVQLCGGGGSARAEEAIYNLGQELRAIPRVQVRDEGAGEAPPGSKGGSWTEILLGVTAAGALAPTIVTVLRDWLLRQPPTTSIKIRDGDLELEWSGAGPPPDIEAFLGRFRGGDPGSP